MKVASNYLQLRVHSSFTSSFQPLSRPSHSCLLPHTPYRPLTLTTFCPRPPFASPHLLRPFPTTFCTLTEPPALKHLPPSHHPTINPDSTTLCLKALLSPSCLHYSSSTTCLYAAILKPQIHAIFCPTLSPLCPSFLHSPELVHFVPPLPTVAHLLPLLSVPIRPPAIVASRVLCGLVRMNSGLGSG